MISRQLIIVADSYIIYSRTLIHTCMHECNYMNVWLSVYGGGRERTGTGEAYIVLSIQVGPFVQEHLRHFYMTTPSGADKSSPIILSETDTHSERERDTSRWQRGMVYMDTQTCYSGLYSASLHVCIYVNIKETKPCFS
jgi:hypothetical protein